MPTDRQRAGFLRAGEARELVLDHATEELDGAPVRKRRLTPAERATRKLAKARERREREREERERARIELLDEARWPSSFNAPLSGRQATAWRTLFEALADIALGTWQGLRPADSETHVGWRTVADAIADRYGESDDAEAGSGWLGKLLDRARDGMGPDAPRPRNWAYATGSGPTAPDGYVAAAIDVAYQDERHRHGLSADACRGLLIEACAGVRLSDGRRVHISTAELAAKHELDEQTARRVIRDGKRGAWVELSARKLLPKPKPTNRDYAAFEERQAYLLRGRGQ